MTAIATKTEPLRAVAIRRLWERMNAIYLHRWGSACGAAAENDDGSLTLVADTWARGLAGVEERAIGAGLDAVIAAGDPWPPTLPEFRAACLRIPTLHAIRAELRERRGDIPSPFLRLVLAGVDTHRLRTSSADASDRIIREAYDAAREHVMRGGALPKTPVALVEAQQETLTPGTEATAAAELDRMAEVLRARTDSDDDAPAEGDVVHCPICEDSPARVDGCRGRGGSGALLATPSTPKVDA